MNRAGTYEEIKPLIELCKTGKLFDVQRWISAGKPINPPLTSEKKIKKRSPLLIAIDCDFHSLVEVLLEGGASIDENRYSPLKHALQKRRLDLVQLLVKHGADIYSIKMESVFDTWDNEIVEFFIEQGADIETGNPLAYALCSRIRPALGIFKRYKERFTSFQAQINIALRHHCKEGSMKWISLLLWAGADPYAKGPDSPDGEPDPELESSALELAAIYGHFEVFKLKLIRLDPKHPGAQGLMQQACYAETSDILRELLDKGFNPKYLEDEGSSLIQSLLCNMSWYFDPHFYFRRPEKNIDNYKAEERIKMIQMLTSHGARWKPENKYDINSARRSLLKMTPDYTIKFLEIMSQYKACTYETIEQLLRTSTMRTLVSKHLRRIDKLMESFQDPQLC